MEIMRRLYEYLLMQVLMAAALKVVVIYATAAVIWGLCIQISLQWSFIAAGVCRGKYASCRL